MLDDQKSVQKEHKEVPLYAVCMTLSRNIPLEFNLLYAGFTEHTLQCRDSGKKENPVHFIGNGETFDLTAYHPLSASSGPAFNSTTCYYRLRRRRQTLKPQDELSEAPEARDNHRRKSSNPIVLRESSTW